MMDIFDLFKRIEKKEGTSNVPITHMIVGLGNPGVKYDMTRHNVGFLMVDAIAEKYGCRIANAKFHAMIGECVIEGIRTVLMKPETFMNNSGEAVNACACFYKIPPENILVISDEISFDVGKMRIRRRGSAGGHNGLKSIIAALGSEEFPRFKIGVGNKPTPQYDLADWVLSKFPKEDLLTLSAMTASVTDAAVLVLKGKIDEAMCKYSK